MTIFTDAKIIAMRETKAEAAQKLDQLREESRRLQSILNQANESGECVPNETIDAYLASLEDVVIAEEEYGAACQAEHDYRERLAA